MNGHFFILDIKKGFFFFIKKNRKIEKNSQLPEVFIVIKNVREIFLIYLAKSKYKPSKE